MRNKFRATVFPIESSYTPVSQVFQRTVNDKFKYNIIRPNKTHLCNVANDLAARCSSYSIPIRLLKSKDYVSPLPRYAISVKLLVSTSLH